MMIRLGSAPCERRPRARRRPRRRSAAKRSCARATIARSARSTYAGASAAGAKPLRCVAKVLHRRGGRLAPLELFALAVDPDHGHVHLQRRGDVGLVAGSDMEPAL